jgi:hypothetical protein
MYPWNGNQRNGNQPADASDDPTEAMRAVQVALDRRDNGGESGANGPARSPSALRVRGSRGQ